MIKVEESTRDMTVEVDAGDEVWYLVVEVVEKDPHVVATLIVTVVILPLVYDAYRVQKDEGTDRGQDTNGMLNYTVHDQ